MNTQEDKTLGILRKLWSSGDRILQGLKTDEESKFELTQQAERWLEEAKICFENLFYNSSFSEKFENIICNTASVYDNELETFEALNKSLGYIAGLGKMLLHGYIKDQFSGINNDASKNCFIAMCFDETLEDIYTFGIKPAVEQLGYIPIRVDEIAHNDKIDSKIFEIINKSRFVIADFTHQRNGVYYEAGYAKGIGLPVVQTCRSDDFNNLHFDIKTINTIKYANVAELKKKLKSHIEKSIGCYKPVQQNRITVDDEIPF